MKILSFVLTFFLLTFLVLGSITIYVVLFNPSLVGGRTMSPIWNRTDLDTTVVSNSFANSTTTPIAVQNPSSATSTIDIFFYNQTGVATSTYLLTCGTSTTAFANPSPAIVNAVSVATSTKVVIANGITTGSTGFTSAGSGVFSSIGIAPAEWFVCKVATVPSTLYTGAFTEVTNTYDGVYTLRFNKLTNQ